jgi:hypothetical protein
VSLGVPICLDSRLGLYRDSKSQQFQRVSLDIQENFDSFNIFDSSVEISGSMGDGPEF